MSYIPTHDSLLTNCRPPRRCAHQALSVCFIISPLSHFIHINDYLSKRFSTRGPLVCLSVYLALHPTAGSGIGAADETKSRPVE